MMNKAIFKIILSTFLSVIIVGCGSKDKPAKDKNIPILSSKNDTFLTAKITRNGKTVDFKNSKKVMIIKVEVSKLVMENLLSEDENSGYKIKMSIVNRKTKMDLTEDQKITYAITKQENDKERIWMTSALLGGDTNQNPKGNFTITKETDTYMEGTFNFKGILMTKEKIDTKNSVEVTEGKFKTRKLNYKKNP